MGPTHAREVALTHESGISVVRSDAEATYLRRRLERPGRVGRYFLTLPGVVALASGLADWLTTNSRIGLALGAFGGVLIVLGVVQHFLYRRDLRHSPVDVLLWPEGLELVLSNGEIRGAMWTDLDLALQLVARRAPSRAKREYLLIWLPDPRIPAVELSPEGFDQIAKAAAEAGLRISQHRRGSRADAAQVIHIEKILPAQPVDIKRTAGTNG